MDSRTGLRRPVLDLIQIPKFNCARKKIKAPDWLKKNLGFRAPSKFLQYEALIKMLVGW